MKAAYHRTAGPLAEFEAIAAHYPAFRAERPRRKHHRLRWIVTSITLLVVFMVAAVAIKLQPTPGPH